MPNIAIDFETLSERYLASTIEMLDTMIAITKDQSKSLEERMAAAKRFDSLSTNIMMTAISSSHLESHDSNARNLNRQLGKLTDKFKPSED